ncbi:hypothetical protein [Halorientalis halophila]|uniref:hypothetical protein n=1 Tax=Halorientalis halophila TaxID=3108499 RepID=UPI00300858AE
MSKHDDLDGDIDERAADRDGFGLNRRTALKGSVVGLAALTGFASNAAAHHRDGHGGSQGGSGSPGGSGANQFRFAGEEWQFMYASSDPGANTSEVRTLMRLDDVKKSTSWQDSLVLQPSIESSLVTDVGLTGDYDRSRAAAGILGWIEIRESAGGDWQMVTIDDDLVAPPTETEVDADGEFAGTTERVAELARGVVAFNTRDFQAQWDLREITEAIETLDQDDILETDWDELFLDLYLRTRSANSFNYTKTNLPGTHDVRLRGALHVFVDDDSSEDVYAEAVVGNRTMLVEPRKIRAAVDSRTEQ